MAKEATDKISVVTVVRNGEKFIRQTIESVKAGGGQGVEHIVIDGASTDGTVGILKEYPHLRWVSEPDNGQLDAIKKGFAMATGNLLCMLMGDDLVMPGAFDTVLSSFRARPGSLWATGQCIIIDAKGREIRRPITAYKNLKLKVHSFPMLLTECYLSAPAVYFRREIYDEFMPEWVDPCTEYDLWLSFAGKYPLLRIEKNLAAFRIHSTSDTGTSRKSPQLRALRASLAHGRGHPIATALARVNYARTVAVYSVLNRFLD